MALSNFFRASDFQRLDTSTYLNDYSRETVETRSPLDYFQSQFRRQKTTLADIANRSRRRQPRRWDPVVDHIKQPRNLFFYRGLIPSVSSVLQVILLVYLLSKYLALPVDPTTGQRERVGNLYSIWPFTSCVGSHHLSKYLGLKLTILTLNATSTSITCYCGRDDSVAWMLRRSVWIFTLIVYGLGTWAVIASKEVDRTLHLFATAAELLCMYTLKGLAFSMEHVTRLRFRSMFHVWAVKVDTWWKIVTMCFAFPLGLMTTVSIYTCEYQDLDEIQTPGRKCYKVMAMGAIAEWLYLITSVSWSASIAFELFTALPAEEAREREEEEERKSLLVMEGLEGDWSRTSTLNEEMTDYNKDEETERASISRPPSYASRADEQAFVARPPSYSSQPTRMNERLSPDNKGIKGISMPDSAKLSDDSRWSASTLGNNGYESVPGGEEMFEDAVQGRSIV